MIEYDIVPFHKIASEIDYERHYFDVFGEKPEVDKNTYIAASMSGRVIIVTARDNGKIIAYSGFVIGHNLRKIKIIEAENHALYVEKSHRGHIGIQLLKKSDEFLTRMGVSEITYRNDNPLFGKWLQKSGYKEKYTIWSKING